VKFNEESKNKKPEQPTNKTILSLFQKINQLFMRINQLFLSSVNNKQVKADLKEIRDRKITQQIYTGSLLTKSYIQFPETSEQSTKQSKTLITNHTK